MIVGTLSRARLNSSPTSMGHVNYSFPDLSPAKAPVSSNLALKTAGQTVITHVGSTSFVGVASPRENQGLRSRTISEASCCVGMRSRVASDVSGHLGQPILARTISKNSYVVTSPRNPELRCRTISESSGVVGIRCGTTSEVLNFNSAKVSPKTVHVGTRSRAPSSTSMLVASVAPALPKSEVDWLMGTLRPEDFSTFDSRFFVNDCRKRFQELDKDKTGYLSVDNLQGALVEMYPTLQLELVADGHRIPAMHKSIPNLVATFDADCDGRLNFDEFVTFVKFQRAWRDNFFLKGNVTCMTKSDAYKAVKKQSHVRYSAGMARMDGLSDIASIAATAIPQPSANDLSKTYSSKWYSADTVSIAATAIAQPSPRDLSKAYSTKRYSVVDASRGALYSSLNSSLDGWMKAKS